MVDFLELPTVRRMVSRVSIEEYHRMPEYNANGQRTELVCGIVIEKVVKTPLHCYLQNCLYGQVAAAVSDGLLALQHDPITMADSEPEPDISVVVGALEDFKDAHPSTALLVIEVADTTVELDRAKATLYAEAGVEECWIVLAGNKAVEVYTAPQDGVYTHRRLYTRAETLVAVALPALQVRLDALFVG